MAEITNEKITALIDEKITDTTLNTLAKTYLNKAATLGVEEFFSLISNAIQGNNDAVFAATVAAMDGEALLTELDRLNSELKTQALESAQVAVDLTTFIKVLITIAASKYGVVL